METMNDGLQSRLLAAAALALTLAATALAPLSMAQEAFDEEGANPDEMQEEMFVIDIHGGDRSDPQSEQDLAEAISAFSGDRLEDRYLTNIERLVGSVPNAGYSSGVTGLSIRGTSNLGRAGNDAGSPIFEDGTLFKSTDFLLSTGNFLSERVELLRGGQDPFYGNNAVGGVLDRVSKKPALEAPEYHSRVSGGRFGRQNIGVTFAGAFTEIFGYRVTAYEANQNGVIENFGDTDSLDSDSSKFQEIQLQLGRGDSTRMWVRSFNINQQSLPNPRVQLANYAVDLSSLSRTGNPYAGYEFANPALTSRYPITFRDKVDNPATFDYYEDFVLAENGMNLSEALSSRFVRSVAEFYDRADPTTLNGLDNPRRVQQNHAGSENLDGTRGSIMHWDQDIGSYLRLSTLGAYNEVDRREWHDGDRIDNSLTETNAVDLLTGQTNHSKYSSREFRIGTQNSADRTLSWLVGQYSYNETTDHTSYSRDAGWTNDTAWHITGQGVAAESPLEIGTTSHLSSQLDIDASDDFFAVGLNFGGFSLAFASRTSQAENTYSYSDTVGYAGSDYGWAPYRAAQWEALKQTVQTGGLVLDATMHADLITALAAEASFYGTSRIASYIETLQGLLDTCLDDEDAATCATSEDGSDVFSIADQFQTLLASDAGYKLDNSIFGTGVPDLLFTSTYRGSQTYDDGESTQASVEISLGDGHLLYFTTLESTRAGGFQYSSGNGASPYYKPETVEGTEYGVKFNWNRFRLNISSFDYEYTDYQALSEHLRDDGTLYRAPFNLPKATATGLEVEWSLAFGNWLQFNLMTSTLDTEVTEGSWTEPLGVLAGTAYELAGNKLPNSPEGQWSANLQIHFSETVFWSVTRRYVDEAYFTVFNSPYAFMAEHEIADVRLVMRSRDDRLRVTLYGENVEDQVSWNHAVEGRFHAPAVSGGTVNWQLQTLRSAGNQQRFTAVSLNPPRTVGLQMDFRF